MGNAAIGTTPTFTLTHNEPDLDWTAVQSMYVSFRSGSKKIRKEGDVLVITRNTVSVLLKQEETLLFQAGAVKIQANWTYPGGLRGATDETTYVMDDNLEKEVLE